MKSVLSRPWVEQECRLPYGKISNLTTFMLLNLTALIMDPIANAPVIDVAAAAAPVVDAPLIQPELAPGVDGINRADILNQLISHCSGLDLTPLQLETVSAWKVSKTLRT